MANCGEKISNTCPDKTEAVCVYYDGERSEKSSIVGNCAITVEAVIEDIYDLYDVTIADIDTSELGFDYIEYRDKKVKTVLLQFEEELGNLNDRVKYLEDTINTLLP